MRTKIISILLLAFVVSSCATVQQQIGKAALKFMTKNEADFNNIAVIGTYQTNVAGSDVGITSLGTEDWQAGENLVGVQLVKPAGAIGVIALDGTVTVDGQEAKSYGGGAYFAKFKNGDRSPKTVKIVSTNGQETEFEISAAPEISIKSVNGKTDAIEIDLSQPLEIELDYAAAAEGKRVMVSLVTNAAGAKGFANFQSFLIGNKISIPAEAFKHKHIAGGGVTGADVTNWVSGSNHLQVTLVEYDRSDSGQPFPYFKKEIKAIDTVPVTVTGNTQGRARVAVKGTSEEPNGKFTFEASSSNAWYARPLNSQIKRIGIASLSVSGTLYQQETETSEESSWASGYRTITTTTTTFEFPQLDDEYWDQFLENIYADLVNTLENEYGATIVDVDEITSNPLYDEFYTPEEENTKEYIAKNLRDTKRLLPTKLGEIIGDRTTSLIADDGTMAKLVRDMNIDALLDVVINYQVAANSDGNIILIPNVSYRVNGPSQAFDGTTHTWMQGNLYGPGVAFSREEFSDLNALNRIGQKDVILKLMRRGLAELTTEQEKSGYQKIWSLAVAE